MFEIKHLKTLTKLAETGNLRKAAEQLFVSQSALSHQIKDLELRLSASLFLRNTSPVQFTQQGKVLLALAEDILPLINSALSELKDEKCTSLQLNLAIACHACFQWLLPVAEQFSLLYPEVKIEFIEQGFTNNSGEKLAVETDILFTDEKEDNDDYVYHALGTFEVVAVLAKQALVKQKLADKAFLQAADFSSQVLLTYPVKTEQLDIFKLFFDKFPSMHKPLVIKQVANSHMILQMVAANMGIAALPDWLVSSLTRQTLVETKRIGETGIYKTLYAKYKKEHVLAKLIEEIIPQTVEAFENLYHTEVLN